MKTIFMGILWILCFMQFTSAETNILRKGHYFLERNDVNKDLTEAINVRSMLQYHLAQFEFQDEEKMDARMSRFSLFNPEKKQKVQVTVAVYPTVSDAEENVLTLLNSASAIFKPGTPRKIEIGNHCWHLQGADGTFVTIKFIRNNVIISVFSSDLDTVESLAKKIDADILAGKNGIKLKDH